MSQYLAVPPAKRLAGRLRVPSSKSATNRALLLAALTAAPVEIVGPLESDDTEALRRCLAAMGADIRKTPDGLRVSGPLRGERGAEVLLDAGDSGTAARFLTAAAAVTPGRFRLGGPPRLCQRPIGELVNALRAAGARIGYGGHEGCLPLEIDGGALASDEVAVDASRSSQFLSALLLSAVAVEGGLRVRPTGAVASSPYVATTLEVLRDFGHEAEAGETIAVRRGGRVAGRYDVPGDYSSAVPLAAAVAAAGGEVTLEGLRWPSGDADAGALPVLEAMGLALERDGSALRLRGDRSALRPASATATSFPDAVPSLAALAMLCPGRSVFSGVGHLRLKESDRLASLAALAEAVGARAQPTEDALAIEGIAHAAPPLVRAPTFRDHRIAMAAGILALRVPGVLVEDPDCVAKSYPSFFRDLEALARR
ncbi:MAG: 3-phosphoshikimate 1-carboxyvinyltransferase [Syntrophomonadaceae bacterium]